MNVVARLMGFVTTLALVFGGAWWFGTATAPPPGTAPPAPVDPHAAVALPPDRPSSIGTTGLVSTASGYTLVPRGSTTFRPGVPAEFAFVVTGPGGRPVTAFDVRDERQLDLVVVSRGGAGFQHVLPAADAGGVWRAQLELPVAGVYRAYATFVPTGGPELVLGVELSAPGKFAPEEATTSRTTQVDDYTVRLDADLVAGTRSEVFVAIDRNRLPVTDVEPRFGQPGQLVVVRQGDMARLRVAPLAIPPEDPHRGSQALAFTVEVPDAGVHRLFVEFQHRGAVHAAMFTVTTGSGQ
ncbi:hypothetical protein ACQEVB_38425 [Pseudonocardia sp. CA-107938]|uniref:hypothetical protein n=1 Tax=Pseudonocardia sp. CA-107938 TaxID=3240021 RepID=UPI003D9135A2